MTKKIVVFTGAGVSNTPELGIYRYRAHHIQKNATIGVPELVEELIEKYN